MDDFYVVNMIGKKLYLGCTNNVHSMKWTTLDDACWFNTYSEAERFAKDYFKNFKNYQIYSFSYSM